MKLPDARSDNPFPWKPYPSSQPETVHRRNKRPDKLYLVTIKDGDALVVEIAGWDKDGWYVKHNHQCGYEPGDPPVVAWIEMPEPYQKARDERGER